MIQYSLKCDQDHRFDSWFQSAAAFDKLLGAGLVTCAICGSAQVDKAIMAPRVRPARGAASVAGSQDADRPKLGQPASDTERAIAALKRKIEQNSEYVGGNFAKEARAMHEGDSPERAIHGEAKPEEARKLLEDGVPVIPLPFLSGRKTN